MSHIDELISRLCPEGVPYREIGSPAVSNRVVAGATPKTGTPEYWEGGTIPWMSSGEVNKGTVYETDRCITQLAYDSTSTKRVPSGTVVMALAGQGKTRGTVARTRIELCTNQSLASIVVADEMNSDFLYYFLQTQYSKLRDVSSGEGSRGGLNLQTIRSYKVPVPPMEVQRAIVEVLDTFSQLEAELEAELAARRQQYEHYSSGILEFDEEVPLVSLEDVISNLRTGLNPRKNFKLNTPDAANHYITVRELSGFAVTPTDKTDLVNDDGLALIQKRARLRSGDVLFSATGTIGRTALVESEPENWNIKEGVYALTPIPELISSRFLIYLLRSQQIRRTILASAEGSTVASVSMSSLRRVQIPLPTIGTQEEVVGVLDKFDALVNDLSIGLPAELNARRQQYEYYRDKLLTFKELEVAA